MQVRRELLHRLVDATIENATQIEKVYLYIIFVVSIGLRE
jgi:hypothetical protein